MIALSIRYARAGALALALLGTPVAKGADVVVVVGPKSRVASLTPSQLADIYLGRSSRYPDGTAAVPIDLPDGTPERDEFYLTVTGKSPAQVKAFWSKIVFTGKGHPPKEAASAAEVKRIVVDNGHAIGYVDRGTADRTVQTVTVE